MSKSDDLSVALAKLDNHLRELWYNRVPEHLSSEKNSAARTAELSLLGKLKALFRR